jgi:3-methylcrotonyl-CoA carboxylase beta subunit
MSAAGIPQLALVAGSCTAGGAYVPALADESVIIRGAGTIFLGGPPLVKAATGEVMTAEDLGGGEMHTSVSGVADTLAESEAHAAALVRRALATLGRAAGGSGAWPGAPATIDEPAHDPAELRGVVPADARRAYDPRSILARLLDGSRFAEHKAAYGATLVTGFGAVRGVPVGVLANAGALVSPAARKGAHFIQLCAQRGTPLLFIQNVAGFMVGRDAERGGIAKDGALMVQALAAARVPKVTLVVGGSHGAGAYGMCGRVRASERVGRVWKGGARAGEPSLTLPPAPPLQAYSPNFLFTWPSSRVGVMSGDAAASVLGDVESAKRKRDGAPWPDADRAAFEASVRAQYDAQGGYEFASARLWDDGCIDPAATRDVLGLALGAAVAGDTWTPGATYGVFRM